MPLAPLLAPCLALALAWLALPPPGPGEGPVLGHLRKLLEHPARSAGALVLATWALRGRRGSPDPSR